MKKWLLFSFFLCCCYIHLSAQELFTYTEPASNMAKGTLGFRLNSTLMKDEVELKNNLHIIPEVMLGISKKWMIHLEGFLSDRGLVTDRNNTLTAEGGSLYLKFRFYSIDEVHSHFRMAAFSRISINNSDVHQEAIDLNGHNSGYEMGFVATKLQHKIALSTSLALLHALDNKNEIGYRFPSKNRDAINYTFSLGKLLLPKTYKDYNQTNMNGMVEILCQTNINTGKTYVDAAPVLQFIFLSKMRADISYRFPLSNDLYRSASKGFLLRLEYNVFNAIK
ncbi:MAG: hypothetical protein WCH52_02945 [Bacteroidota bacterium]